MEFEVGQRYYKAGKSGPTIRLITKMESGLVHYEVLYGPAKKKHQIGCVSERSMQRWITAVYEGDDQYDKLAGCVIHKTFIVQQPDGKPVFRCSRKRADWYLNKGYAQSVEEGVIRFNDDNRTVQTLIKLYGPRLSPFFMNIKNSQCVVCGVDRPLTRHHVIPKRILHLLPNEAKLGLSNILFVCVSCHQRYNENDIKHQELDPAVWLENFMTVMQPKFMPEGWNLYMVEFPNAINNE